VLFSLFDSTGHYDDASLRLSRKGKRGEGGKRAKGEKGKGGRGEKVKRGRGKYYSSKRQMN
jgi:hypothetical protein